MIGRSRRVCAAAWAQGGWALAGGSRLLFEITLAPYDHPSHLALVDAALLFLQEQGCNSGHLNGYEVDRWLATRGSLRVFDGLELAVVPVVGDEPVVEPPAVGEARRLTSLWDGEGTPYTEVEHRAEGVFVAVTDGPSTDDGPPRRVRYDWITAPTYEQLLRELGDRMVSSPAWAHPDLEPYFPWRSPSS